MLPRLYFPSHSPQSYMPDLPVKVFSHIRNYVLLLYSFFCSDTKYQQWNKLYSFHFVIFFTPSVSIVVCLVSYGEITKSYISLLWRYFINSCIISGLHIVSCRNIDFYCFNRCINTCYFSIKCSSHSCSINASLNTQSC